MIGIDPGSRVTGYGVVEAHGNRLVHVASGSINAVKQSKDFSTRLEVIHDELTAVIVRYAPNAASLEGIFHHKNAASALKLGHARGVILLTLRKAGLEVAEYAPTRVKQAVVGYGRADKEQVRKMVSLLLGIPEASDLDTSDALANAICHLNSLPMLHRLR